MGVDACDYGMKSMIDIFVPHPTVLISLKRPQKSTISAKVVVHKEIQRVPNGTKLRDF